MGREDPAPVIEPFRIDWPAHDVERVLERVRATRLPAAPAGAGWSLGCDVEFLERFRTHWLERYDWRAALGELNRWPQHRARIDGVGIHFVHVIGEAGGRRPLLLLHGWPGSHFEFFHLIERLAFPGRHGDDPADAFDLVIPSLVGYGYSDPPGTVIGPRHMAGMLRRLMTDPLGYQRFLVQGGDWGSIIASWMGVDHAAAVRSIHLNMLPFTSTVVETDEERAFLDRLRRARSRLTGYSTLQFQKPQSLALAAADNPLGVAAWILERFHDWSDRGQGGIDAIFGLDALITNVMIYVMSGSFASSLWLYHGVVREGQQHLRTARVDVPTACAAFPRDALQPPTPRSLAARSYNIVRWSDFERGGHFAALEQPEAFLTDLREWGRQVG
jgi:pimeloyl-ACP methyl ester carboxylesterase